MYFRPYNQGILSEIILKWVTLFAKCSLYVVYRENNNKSSIMPHAWIGKQFKFSITITKELWWLHLNKKKLKFLSYRGIGFIHNLSQINAIRSFNTIVMLNRNFHLQADFGLVLKIFEVVNCSVCTSHFILCSSRVAKLLIHDGVNVSSLYSPPMYHTNSWSAKQ